MKPLHLLGLFAAAAAGITIFRIAGAGAGAEGGIDLAAHLNPGRVELGQALYGEYCASCHGANLEGQDDWQQRDAEGYLPAPPHDASGHTWHHPTRQLFQITRHGTEAMVGGGYRSRMIGFEGTLDDSEILAVLAYIKSTWPPRIIARHDELDAAYEEAARP